MSNDESKKVSRQAWEETFLYLAFVLIDLKRKMKDDKPFAGKTETYTLIASLEQHPFNQLNQYLQSNQHMI